MKIISVINYKGGVGKTTLTANIAAALSDFGKKVLLLDMDPQCSLTFSFMTEDYWEDHFAEKQTIKTWFEDKLGMRSASKSLIDFVVTGTVGHADHMFINTLLHYRKSKGKIAIIPSHLDLLDNIDLRLAKFLAGFDSNEISRQQVEIYGMLRRELRPLSNDYDIVLLDCPPNFNIVTKNALVAADGILIPTKPDSLSTKGMFYLVNRMKKLVKEFNNSLPAEESINPAYLGVVFTMVQEWGRRPINVQRKYKNQIEQMNQQTGISPFKWHMCNGGTMFGSAPDERIPAVLLRHPLGDNYDRRRMELKMLAAEFGLKIGLMDKIEYDEFKQEYDRIMRRLHPPSITL